MYIKIKIPASVRVKHRIDIIDKKLRICPNGDKETTIADQENGHSGSKRVEGDLPDIPPDPVKPEIP